MTSDKVLAARKAELPALTGIRFYAALFVYLSHVAETIPGMDALAGQSRLFNAGVVSVSLFFVLSGFILTYNYAGWFENGISAADYKRFVWDRLTRIYPVHFLTTLMVLPIAAFSPHLPLDWRAVPVHLAMLQCFWPSSKPTFYNYLNVPSWSISCEWFFYLLAPVAIFFALGGIRRWAPVVVTAVYGCGLMVFLGYSQSAFARLYFVSWFAPSRFVEFLVGVFLARIFLNASLRESTTMSGLAQGAGIVLLVAGAQYRLNAPWPLHGGLLYLPGAALLVIGLARGRGFLVAHLRRPWVTHLGRASFSLYLVHAPILRAVRSVCFYFGWVVQSWPVFCAVTLGMFVIVQTAALIIYHGYEMPLQKRLRRALPQRSALAMSPSAA